MAREKTPRKNEGSHTAADTEAVTQPHPVISAQSEYPQKTSAVSGHKNAQKTSADARQGRNSTRAAKNAKNSSGTSHDLEDAAKPQNQGLFRAAIALYGILIVLYAGWQVFLGVRAVPENDGLVMNASLESNYAFFSAIYCGLGLSFLFIAVKFEWVNMLVISCLVVFLGGVGRIISWATHGTPHWSLIVLMVTELVIPPCFVVWYAWINKSNKIRRDMLQASRQGKTSR